MTEAKRRASGNTEVKSYERTPYDELAGGPSLVEARVRETFVGDIQGEGTVRVTQALHQDGSGTFVGIERVRGTLHGRRGSFLLQVSGTLVRKDLQARWFVVPGSGTEELKGLSGDGGFQAQVGERGTIWLDYELD
jgi:hypothetical protein